MPLKTGLILMKINKAITYYKIKSEKTHGSFPISLYGLFAVGRTDFFPDYSGICTESDGVGRSGWISSSS